jgi:hypothetical protein
VSCETEECGDKGRIICAVCNPGKKKGSFKYSEKTFIALEKNIFKVRQDGVSFDLRCDSKDKNEFLNARPVEKLPKFPTQELRECMNPEAEDSRPLPPLHEGQHKGQTATTSKKFGTVMGQESDRYGLFTSQKKRGFGIGSCDEKDMKKEIEKGKLFGLLFHGNLHFNTPVYVGTLKPKENYAKRDCYKVTFTFTAESKPPETCTRFLCAECKGFIGRTYALDTFIGLKASFSPLELLPKDLLNEDKTTLKASKPDETDTILKAYWKLNEHGEHKRTATVEFFHHLGWQYDKDQNVLENSFCVADDLDDKIVENYKKKSPTIEIIMKKGKVLNEAWFKNPGKRLLALEADLMFLK